MVWMVYQKPQAALDRVIELLHTLTITLWSKLKPTSVVLPAQVVSFDHKNNDDGLC